MIYTFKDYLIQYAKNNNLQIDLHLLSRYIKLINYYQNNHYTEKGDDHHIIPKSIVPELRNESENIIHIPYKAHFLCHLMLTRIFYNKVNSLLYAFNTMKNTRSGRSNSCQSYQEERRRLSEIQSIVVRKRYKTDPTIKQKISLKTKLNFQKVLDGDPIAVKKESLRNYRHSKTLKNKNKEYWQKINEKRQNTFKNKTIAEQEAIKTKRRNVLISINNNLSEETKIKLAKNRKDHMLSWWATASESDKAKRNKNNSLGQQKLSILTCPYCGKQTKSRGNMKKYHGENCLQNPNLSEEQKQQLIEKRKLQVQRTAATKNKK